MGADSLAAALAAAKYIGVSLDPAQRDRLRRFHEFLAEEAGVAGGIGPNEIPRLWRRHIADALLFGVDCSPAETWLDVGTGVGLPGIPLAVALPDSNFTLLDRSQRRTDLALRACSILGLQNCEVVQGDVSRVEDRYHRVVARASLGPESLMIHVKRLLRPGGVAIIGLSRQGSDRQIDETPGLQATTIQVEILDTTVSLLRIVAT